MLLPTSCYRAEMVPKEGTPTPLAQKYMNKQRGNMVQVPFTLRDHCLESQNLRNESQFQISVWNLILGIVIRKHGILALGLLKL